jgi:hypothetical protein
LVQQTNRFGIFKLRIQIGSTKRILDSFFDSQSLNPEDVLSRLLHPLPPHLPERNRRRRGFGGDGETMEDGGSKDIEEHLSRERNGAERALVSPVDVAKEIGLDGVGEEGALIFRFQRSEVFISDHDAEESGSKEIGGFLDGEGFSGTAGGFTQEMIGVGEEGKIEFLLMVLRAVENSGSEGGISRKIGDAVPRDPALPASLAGFLSTAFDDVRGGLGRKAGEDKKGTDGFKDAHRFLVEELASSFGNAEFGGTEGAGDEPEGFLVGVFGEALEYGIKIAVERVSGKKIGETDELMAIGIFFKAGGKSEVRNEREEGRDVLCIGVIVSFWIREEPDSSCAEGSSGEKSRGFREIDAPVLGEECLEGVWEDAEFLECEEVGDESSGALKVGRKSSSGVGHLIRRNLHGLDDHVNGFASCDG